MRTASGKLRDAEKYTSPILVEMHASDRGRVTSEDFQAVASLSIPHAESTVGGTANHQVPDHLRGPHATGMADESTKTLNKNVKGD